MHDILQFRPDDKILTNALHIKCTTQLRHTFNKVNEPSKAIKISEMWLGKAERKLKSRKNTTNE